MPPRTRRPAGKLSAADVSSPAFPTWDDLVAEAHDQADLPPYQLPLPGGEVIEVPVFDGQRYLDIVRAQRRGDGPAVMEALFPDVAERTQVIAAMKGVHWVIVDVLAAKILRYFYGLDVAPKPRSDLGNPDTEGTDEDAAEEAASEVGKSFGS